MSQHFKGNDTSESFDPLDHMIQLQIGLLVFL